MNMDMAGTPDLAKETVWAGLNEWLRSLLAWVIGLPLFVLLCLSAIVGVIFFDPGRYDPWIKRGCRALLRVIGVHVQVEDHGGRQPNGTYLFMANHVNLLDGFLFMGHIPHFVRAVEVITHFSWPLYGAAIRRLGNIPIDRQQPHRAMASLSAAAEALQKGRSILIMPEGTRTTTGRLLPFKRGPFLLAQNVGVDIVPVVQIGGFTIQRKGSLRIRPGRMRLLFLKPISYIEIAIMKDKEVRDLVRQRMLDYLE